MSPTEQKRKRKSVDVQVKLRALNEMKQGISSRVIANKLQLSLSTVHSWKKNEEALRSFEQENGIVPTNKKRLRRPENQIVDEATWAWFEQNRDSGCFVSGPMIKAEALNFFKRLGGSKSFEASDGWLSNFKNRHGIKRIPVNDEKSSTDHDTAQSYSKKLLDIIQSQGLTPDQVFNCNETGFNFRQTPRSTQREQIEPRNLETKVQDERYTVMACSNASGSIKLPLLVIGKSAKLKSIKTLTHLPVIYKSHKNLCMSADLFDDWFHEHFVPFISSALIRKGLPVKAVLFIDNSSIYTKNLANDKIQVHLFPPNTTSIIQPMDQGCLQNFKLLYRKGLMEFLTEKLSKDKNLGEILKRVTIREILFWVANAWDSVTQVTIIESWKLLWPALLEMESLKEALAFSSSYPSTDLTLVVKKFHQALMKQKDQDLITENDVYDWLNCNTLQNRDECLDSEKIVEIFKDKRDMEKENSSRETHEIPKDREITLEEAKTSIERIIKFCEARRTFSKLQMLALNEVRDSIFQ